MFTLDQQLRLYHDPAAGLETRCFILGKNMTVTRAEPRQLIITILVTKSLQEQTELSLVSFLVFLEKCAVCV